MVHSEAQQPVGTHLVLYDGVCGLCNRLLQFLLRHDRHRVFRFASLQSVVGASIVERSGGNPAELTSFYVVADYETGAPRVFTRSDAALFVAGALGWPWRAAQLTRFVPHAIRDRAYDLVARSRYRVFGRYERCLVPRPEFRNRFIEGQAGEL
jgi:predicted DCC family thiol-disulfide oxidoreductase YuxK